MDSTSQFMDSEGNYCLFRSEFQFLYMIKDVYRDLPKYFGKPVNQHIRRAMAEWYFMLQQDSRDPLLLEKEAGMKHEANSKLIQILTDHNLDVNCNEIPFLQYLWEAIEIARRKYSTIPRRLVVARWNDSEKQMEINYRLVIYHDRLETVRNRFKCDDVLLGRIALTVRNDFMNHFGFRSSERSKVVDLLYHSFQVRFEGFASVLDSVLLTYEDTNWCSMFEVDKQFGSMGNFFHLDLSKREHQGCWMLNPPFIESIIDDMAFKVLHSLRFDRVESCFFISMPIWSDMWAWKNLRNSRFLLGVMDDLPLMIEHLHQGRITMVASEERRRCFLIVGHSKYSRDDFDKLEQVLRDTTL